MRTNHTILVTGGAGFIGSHLVTALLEQKKHVVCLDKLTYAAIAPQIDSADIDLEVGDICDAETVSTALRKYGPAQIVHLAAETHVDRSIDAPRAFTRTNVFGTQVLLDATLDYWRELDATLKQDFRFVYVSTDEVYGSIPVGSAAEDATLLPNSPYAASKAAADHFVRAYQVTFGLPTVTLRTTNNYGPRQFPEKLIPLMLLSAIQGRRLPVYGQGTQRRCWLHVEDHVQGILSALKHGSSGSVYNLGSAEEKDNLQVVQELCAVVDRLLPEVNNSQRLIEFVQDRPGHDFRYCVDDTKATAELGWKPKIPFEQGLEQTVAWYLSNQEWVAAVCQKSGYRGGRLGAR